MTRRILDGRNRWMATVAATTIAACLSTAASPVRAADRAWIDGHTGSWFDSVNWDSGVPTAADNAFVNNGSVTIGGAASSSAALIGDRLGSIGTVTVDGAGSSWTLTGVLFVGNFGTGTLKVNHGGTVSSAIGVMGAGIGTSGTAIVDGNGSSWTTTGGLTVGDGGSGALTVSNGGVVSGSFGVIGNGATSNSSAVVDGKDSRWTTTGGLIVGENGTGALTVSNGGAVSSSLGVIGDSAGSDGTVIVDGKDSRWTNTGRLVVGSSGTGALTVSNGGAVSSADGLIGFTTTGTVIVDGTGSRWTNTGEVNVGGNSIGVLTVSNGGAVSGSLLNIAFYGISTGTINIGAATGDAAVAPGTLDTPEVHFGSGAGKLVFNHIASDYVFAPKISSDTSNHEVDVYAGTTILTAANTYTGPTNIFGGALLVNGSIVSPATVFSGGTFGGTGTVGDTTVKSGGTFAPGNGTPGSSITVAGSLAFESGARYLVQVNPSVASSASVSGTATLTGAMVEANFAPGTYVQKQYTILTAATLDGTFAGLTGNAPAGTVALDYGTNDVFLNITLGFANAPVYSALNANQRAVADTLNNYFNTTGGIPGAFFSLSPQGLSQVSGELATGSQQATFDAMNMFMGVMTDPFMAGRGNNAASYSGGGIASSYAAQTGRTGAARDAYAAIATKAPPRSFEEYWSAWGAGYGGSQTTSGNAATGSNTATSQIYGGAAGADYHLSPDTMVGFALGGGGTNFSVANSGTGRSDLFQAGAFARHEMGAAYITAAFAYGWQNITTDRTVTAAGIDRLHASFDANAYSGRVESGWRFVSPIFGGLGLTPYAAGQVTLFDLPSYGEQALSGSNQFALSYASKDATATRSELGLRADKSFAVSDAIFTLRGRAAWAHNFDPDHAIGATFQTLPGASFVVNGAAQAGDSALISASAETRWLNGWSLAGTFEGEFSSVTNSYAGKGVVKYAW